jgi:2-polyprenyl-6-methoxyphenol hydroxylase-like FAD-dependent oxidoreductase
VPSRGASITASQAIEHHTKVLVVGAGPAGLIAAWQLSRHGVQCMLAERNLDTTKWPKMDITNCRSMELLRRLDLAEGLRKVGKLRRHPSFAGILLFMFRRGTDSIQASLKNTHSMSFSVQVSRKVVN